MPQLSLKPTHKITNDPNCAEDPQYIVRLIGQVVAVSLETAAIVAGLPALEIVAA